MSQPRCLVDGCTRRVRGRGWCGTHYERWRKTGSVELRRRPTSAERFWSFVDAAGDCWLWLGTKSRGYGTFYHDRHAHSVVAHRWAYEYLCGPIGDGLQLDHLCRNPSCVNPDHLEPVTGAENIRRAYPTKKTHCPSGHKYEGRNLYIDKRGYRRCRSCNNIRTAVIRQRRGAPAIFRSAA
jgi:hypothetical protein